jgi:hypothetical protein
MAIGPDTFMDRTTADLNGKEEEWETLAEVWPRAFVAAGLLRVRIYEGKIPEDTKLLHVKLPELVKLEEQGEYS